MDVSLLIAARNEQYLQRTIESVLAASEADTEVVAVADGYWPEPVIKDHPRVTLIHHTEARGQRQSINEAARVARGKYLMKLDSHCSVGPGFDRILIEDYQPGWTVVPRMYGLDIETWQPKTKKPAIDYMYISAPDAEQPFRAQYFEGKEKDAYRHQPVNDKLIDETMCCMGPGWFLSADQFWKQDGCDEGHGGWGNQGVEVSLKAWLSGNALMVNKRTWFAHWFRGGGGPGFPYAIGGRTIDAARKYSRDLWLNNRWPKQVRTLQWLVAKFNPPGWETVLQENKQLEMNAAMYQHLHRQSHEPFWRGIHIIKMPTDLLLYHKIIWENEPKWIIETGTKFGGSALFFQDTLDLLRGGGRVITIDTLPAVDIPDSRITYITGSSIDRDVVQQVREMVGDDPVMVVLDSAHARKHVKWELYLYGPLVTQGQYLVIEDCLTRGTTLYGPGEARDWFLKTREGRAFVQTNLDREFLVGVCLGGWLRRK